MNEIPLTIYLIVLCIIGTIGNLHVIVVFSLRYKNSIYKTFVLYLAILNFLSCLVCIPLVLYLITQQATIQSPILCKFTFASAYFIAATSLGLLDAIAIWRYIKVCRATRVEFTVCTARTMCVVVTVLILTGVVIPVMILYGINNKGNSRQEYECAVLNEYKNSIFLKIYRGAVFIVYIIMWAACISMYLTVLRKIKQRQIIMNSQKSKSSRKCTSKAPKRDNKISKQHDSFVSNHYPINSHTVCTSAIECTGETIEKLTDTGNKVNIEEPYDSRVELDCSKDNERSSEWTLYKDESTEANDQSADKNIKDKTRTSKPISTSISNVDIKKKRKRINKSRKLTIMFIVVSWISFAVYLPYIIFTAIETNDGQLYGTITHSNAILASMIKWLFFLNNAVNPVIYGFMDNTFRKHLSSLYQQIKTCKSSILP